MTYLLGLDLETTSSDIENCHILEIGMVLWDADEGRLVCIVDNLINQAGVVIPDEIVKITGIRQEYLQMVGIPLQFAIDQTAILMRKADAVVAHNGLDFDRPVLERVAREVGANLPDIPWIDTMVDVEYPSDITSLKLKYLAADHGILLEGGQAHRAVFDVMAMLRILSQYPLPEILNAARSPFITVRALVSYDEKDLAKRRRYLWDAENKRWIKKIREAKRKDEEDQAPFEIVIVPDF